MTAPWGPPPPAPAPAPIPPPPPAGASAPARRRRWPWVVLAAAGVLGLTAAATALVLATVERAEPGATCPGADGRTRELRRCMQPVLAFVETPFGSGSGVLLADGYVITNAHVVDPFATVTVTLAGERFDEVEVTGVDATADIALLGPLDLDVPGVELISIEGFDEQDEPEVFLLGYPGGIEDDDPAITISDGVVSRLRDNEVTGLRYVQTDAAIAGGQSGGALVDGSGRLLGISGLGFAEEFALALSTDDVMTAVQRIRADGGDDRRTMPVLDDPDEVEQADLRLDQFSPWANVVFAAGPARSVELTITPAAELTIDISTSSGDVIGSNQAFLDQLVEDDMFTEDEVADMPLLEEDAPGVFRFELPSEELTFVDLRVVGGSIGLSVDVSIGADEPFVTRTSTVRGATLDIGAPTRGVLDGFAWEAQHDVTLDEPGEYVVTVSAGASDAYLTVLAPGDDYDFDAEPTADDGGGGLYGLDAEYRFEVDDDEVGTWTVIAGTWDGVITGYTVTVERG